jgi:hypothetical protein
MTGISRSPSTLPIVWAVLGVCSGLAMAYAAWVLMAPDLGLPPAFPYQDKVYHFICFGALTGPAVLALPRRYQPFWLAHIVALGGGVEIVQGMAGEGRSADVTDFLADLVGIAVAFAIARLIRARFEKP